MEGHRGTTRERLLHEYKLGRSATEARQNTCVAEGDGSRGSVRATLKLKTSDSPDDRFPLVVEYNFNKRHQRESELDNAYVGTRL
ncbi:unnamed protein product [Heligmosomoides polygyrus]|uniref:HTH_48 domain-containing protein n=1 Tax=Heligmosomoides polygyrus TaxID=6339 RepID=A0A183FPC9_HELPZ|nr:unnamed protein product [Heligmosomoides polygyrus]